jgi:hypothetical protein
MGEIHDREEGGDPPVNTWLPALIVLDQTAVVKPGGAAAVPAMIAAAGEQASWRYPQLPLFPDGSVVRCGSI